MSEDYLSEQFRKAFGENVNPVLEMAKMAMDEELSPSLRLKAWANVSTYLFAQKKAIEMNATISENRDLKDKLIKEIMEGKPDEKPEQG